MLVSNVSYQFLNNNRLANSGASEQTDLTALGVGTNQIGDLYAGFQ